MLSLFLYLFILFWSLLRSISSMTVSLTFFAEPFSTSDTLIVDFLSSSFFPNFSRFIYLESMRVVAGEDPSRMSALCGFSVVVVLLSRSLRRSASPSSFFFDLTYSTGAFLGKFFLGAFCLIRECTKESKLFFIYLLILLK